MIDLFAVDLDQPTETLARWWNQFNHWDWPPELADLKPPEPLSRDHEEKITLKEYHLIWPIMRAIEEKITFKECLRWAHTHNLGSTDAEFEQWWAGLHRRL